MSCKCKVVLNDDEIITVDHIGEAIDYCKKNNQYKKYVVICPALEYTILGIRKTQTHIDWINTTLYEI